MWGETMKQKRNQHTGASGITQREADTIKRCMDKLLKIGGKKNLYVRHQWRIERSVEQLAQLLVEADRK